ncbi:MAG TPA: hypothetical protein VIG51_03310 [Candidatus Baltobacteraceae bacterium]|jgi:phosphopantetheine adenylyltransferase
MNKRALRTLAAGATLLLASCAHQPQLPVTVRQCDAVVSGKSFVLDARVHSDARVPIRGVRVTVDFYSDFTYSHFVAEAKLARELDPGQTQIVTFQPVNAKSPVRGRAMKCTATHLDYLDGTTADLPPVH